ncbi:MAG TPA: DsbA family protein [Conexibacter sp.]|nr:DsbA family protein [Conexibacter sp.]
MPASPRFLIDVGSPYAYLAAERVERVLPVAPVWEPVLLGGIFRATGGGSWALTEARPLGIEEVERRALDYGLPPLRWPEPWPGDMLLAMRAATAADLRGAGRAFLLAALRLGFREGRDLGSPDAIADAAGAAGIEGDELLAAAADPAVKATLRERTDAAVAAGVRGVPTVIVGDEAFWGDDRLEDAAAACRGV